ncbi:MAG TPA: hypothetical protein VFU02_15925 [Polyangiaceae bacterium]|nr:hypothetical protein [Polyangiaceae bacterium]
MPLTPDLEALKQAFLRQNGQLSHLKQVLSELDPELVLSMRPDVFDVVDEALDPTPTPTTGMAFPLLGKRA